MLRYFVHADQKFIMPTITEFIFFKSIDIWPSLFIIIGKAWSYMKFKAHMAKILWECIHSLERGDIGYLTKAKHIPKGQF